MSWILDDASFPPRSSRGKEHCLERIRQLVRKARKTGDQLGPADGSQLGADLRLAVFEGWLTR